MSEPEAGAATGSGRTEANLASISVFFPCYNDAYSIGTLIANIDSILQMLTDDYEIIVVDDGSTDESRHILDEAAKQFGKLRVILHERNQGYGAALRSGIQSAKKDLVFYTDGDGQYDVTELPALVKLMTERISVVTGYKINRSDPFYRIVIGRLYQYGTRICFNLKIRDVNCDFRLFRRAVIQNIVLEARSGAIGVEMIRKLQNVGCIFAEAPVHHFPRMHGVSQFFNFRNVLMTLIELGSIWLNEVVLKSRVTRRRNPL